MIALMKRILSAAGKYKWRIQLAIVFSFLKSFLAKAPIGMSFFIIAAFVKQEITADMCMWIGIFMAASVVLQIICQNVSDRLQSAAGFMIFAEKRMELGAHLRKMPMGYFTEGNMGKISSVLSTDMVFVEENCMTALADMMSYLFAEAVMLGFLFFYDYRLGLSAVLVLIIILVIAKGMRKEALEDSAKRQEQSEKLTEAVLDFTEGIGIIKTYNLLGEKSKELTDNFDKSCEVSIAFENGHAPWQRGLNLSYGLGSVLVLIAALFLHSKGILDVTFVIGIMLFVFDLFGPLKALYSQIARLTVMNSCMDRMEEIFAQMELCDNGKETISPEGAMPEIEFSNVGFGYTDTDVLKNVSFTARKNEMIALVGPSGGGKSTIANLLARFWDVREGQILVRGTDIRQLPLSELMNHISMVFQRVYLFQDTIYNNISMGRPDASEAEVIAAARKARCYDFIMALPDGFQTVVGEGGATLSGGEKQRISIARCILKDAPIVILDEATASVDADNESYIQDAISELCEGKTLLVIAHRLNTIKNADKILVVAEGGIAQSGTHEELMAQEGIYKNFITVREH